eukprot:scaffold61299_cov59-Phaeocystis_antarctica.AAC.3
MTSSSSPRCRAGRMRSCAPSSRAAVRSGPDRDWYRVINIFRKCRIETKGGSMRHYVQLQTYVFSHAEQCKFFTEKSATPSVSRMSLFLRL